MKENSILKKEIGEIINTGEYKFRKMTMVAILHTPDFNIRLTKLFAVDMERNFNANLGDMITLQTYMAFGDFLRHVNPYKDNLQISLQIDLGIESTVDRYKAILLNDGKNVDNGHFDELSTEQLNVELAYLDFQLVDQHLDKMLQATTTGIFRKKKVLDVMSVMMGEKWDESTEENEQYGKSISIIKPHNEKEYEQIIIPPKLPVLDLPTFLHNMDYGVYYGDVGTYIQPTTLVERGDIIKDAQRKEMKVLEKHRTLYVFPLYNIGPDNRKERKLKIFVAKDNAVTEIERTFLIDETKSIRIIATADSNLKDMSFTSKRAVGKKDTYIDSDSVMTRSFDVTTDKIKTTDANHMVLEDTGTFEDKSINSTHHGIIANKFKFVTDTMKVEGLFAKFTWKQSYPDLLHPGMMVEVFYEKLIDNENTLIKLTGVLHGVFSSFNGSTEMVSSDLVVFVVKSE